MKPHQEIDDRVLASSYEHCSNIARAHYENFPVGSMLIPKRHRPAVAAVYAFARHGDDIADEGDDSVDQRLARLDEWRRALNACLDAPSLPEFIALGDTVKRYGLSLEPFHRLLDAFKQDIVKERYESFEEVLDYCTRSADPVGRIILALFGCASGATFPPADALCTGLQLANFWQDVSVDIRKPRIYIPAEDLSRFGIGESDLRTGHANAAFKRLMKFEVDRTRQYFWSATSLFAQVPLRLRLELKAIWRGGVSILDAIEQQDYDVLARRPALSMRQYFLILTGSVFPVRATNPGEDHAG